ncbi:MAG TPA: hypothetical protein VHY79_15810, partial [Rhizomicrobium sp.]|nr:hypothetical protein [Rhizomicrobium sp.]
MLLAGVAGLALAQSTPLAFTCIVGKPGTPPFCPDASSSTPLINYNSPPGPAHISVAGYFSPNDGGAGEYLWLGSTGGSAPLCVSDTYTATGSAGSSTMTSVSVGGFPTTTLANFVVGELVSGSGTDSMGRSVQTQPGTEIASIDVTHGKIGLTLPLAGTGMAASISGNFTGDNGGTLIIDAGGDCYQKTNYRGDPHEFGARGDGQTDDTMPLQNWFGAYGNLNSVFAPTTSPPNFGPWNASVPANYLVTAPLLCPENALIQGLATQISGTDNGGAPVV